MSKLRSVLITSLSLAAFGCSDVDPEVVSSIESHIERIDVCHYDGTGGSQIITIADPAYDAHEAHGDHRVAAETCDAIDNDCDGTVDDGLVQSCSTSCGTGTQTCSGGAWSTCNAPPPSPEVCDGIDNDCNGQVDETCCVRVLLHCDPNSEEILTLCGPGPHDISANTFVNTNISYLDFTGGFTGANLTKCRLGGGSPDTVTITGDTNLCELQGGCCDDPTRYNDNVCMIELF
jgi:hypothetical protein